MKAGESMVPLNATFVLRGVSLYAGLAAGFLRSCVLHRRTPALRKRGISKLSTWTLRAAIVLLVGVLVTGSALYLYTIARAKLKVHIGWRDASEPGPADDRGRSRQKRRALYGVGKGAGDGDADGDAFPRVIHQLWKTERIPEKFAGAVASCRAMNPTWRYRLWTDRLIDEFVAREYPQFYETFRSYRYPIQRVDVARYFILFHYGGVTIDIDLECRVPLDAILRDKTDYDLILPETDPAGVTVEFMAAKSRRQFIERVVRNLNQTTRDYVLPYVTIIFATGPMYLTNNLVDYPRGEQIYVIPQDVYRNEYFRNLHSGSWHRWDYLLIRFLYGVFNPYTLVLVVVGLVALGAYRCRHRATKPVSLA